MKPLEYRITIGTYDEADGTTFAIAEVNGDEVDVVRLRQFLHGDRVLGKRTGVPTTMLWEITAEVRTDRPTYEPVAFDERGAILEEER